MGDAEKELAGRAAADLVSPDTVVGLGTGSTATFAIRRLGERVREQGLRIRGIPTSNASAELARACGIPLTTFDETTRIDLTIDGADEVSPDWTLVKGGGGALLREKVVASRSHEVVIVIDGSKLVQMLAVAFPLPVEVVPFAAAVVAEELEALGASPVLRLREGEPYVTDNGNWILDARFEAGIVNPGALETAIDTVPGVVESGLFVNLVDCLVIGRENGPEIRRKLGASRRGRTRR